MRITKQNQLEHQICKTNATYIRLEFIIVSSTPPNVHGGMHDLAKPIFWFESGGFRAKNVTSKKIEVNSDCYK